MKSKFLKIFFNKDTILLALVVIWAWFTISLTVDQNANIASFDKHTGSVQDLKYVITRIKNKPLFKDTTCEVQIKLWDRPKYYKTIAKCSNEVLIAQLDLGDTITILTRNKVWGIFGMGDNTQIQHLEQNGKVLIDSYANKESRRNLNVLTGIATLCFLIWYVYQIRRRLYWDTD